jgi:hypothetical protein
VGEREIVCVCVWGGGGQDLGCVVGRLCNRRRVVGVGVGVGKFGFPAAVLDLFWGVLNEKRKAEEVRGSIFVCLGVCVWGGGGGRGGG